MTKLCKQCPNGHRAGSNSQKKCHECGHHFYRKRYTPRIKSTKKCPLCKVRVGGNNTTTCQKCGHIFQKNIHNLKKEKHMEEILDWYLDELANDVETEKDLSCSYYTVNKVFML